MRAEIPGRIKVPIGYGMHAFFFFLLLSISVQMVKDSNLMMAMILYNL